MKLFLFFRVCEIFYCFGVCLRSTENSSRIAFCSFHLLYLSSPFFRLVNFPISQYSGLRFIVPANLCALYFYYQHIVVAIVIPFRDVAYHPRNSGVHIVSTYFRSRLIWLQWSWWKLHSCVPSSCHGAKASGPSFPSSNVGNSFLSPQSIFCASPTAIVCRLCCSLVRETGNAKNT